MIVLSQLNPTDLPSRGSILHQMLNSFWWEGLQWLKKKPRDSRPILEINPDKEKINSEYKKSATLVTSVNVNKHKWYERFSKISKVVRILAWIKRFIKNLGKKELNKDKLLSASEVQKSIYILCSLVQRESFPKVTESIKGLKAIRDPRSQIRVKTSIIGRNDHYSFKYPILLS